MDDGEELEIGAGDASHIPPGHDAWVVSDEPYVGLDFVGAAEYAKSSYRARRAKWAVVVQPTPPSALSLIARSGTG
jgi:hypothetical protein